MAPHMRKKCEDSSPYRGHLCIRFSNLPSVAELRLEEKLGSEWGRLGTHEFMKLQRSSRLSRAVLAMPILLNRPVRPESHYLTLHLEIVDLTAPDFVQWDGPPFPMDIDADMLVENVEVRLSMRPLGRRRDPPITLIRLCELCLAARPIF